MFFVHVPKLYNAVALLRCTRRRVFNGNLSETCTTRFVRSEFVIEFVISGNYDNYRDWRARVNDSSGLLPGACATDDSPRVAADRGVFNLNTAVSADPKQERKTVNASGWLVNFPGFPTPRDPPPPVRRAHAPDGNSSIIPAALSHRIDEK